VNSDEKKSFLTEFEKADINRKLDLWYYAVEQEAIWEELLAEMSTIAQALNPKVRIAED
jgi:hypothetical protein